MKLQTTAKTENIPSDRHCEVCSSLIVKNKKVSFKQHSVSRFCSIVCKGKHQSVNNVGEKNYNYKNSLPNCTVCLKKLTVYRNDEDIKCRECFILTNKGKNHVRWGGKTVLNKDKGRMFPACINCNQSCSDSKSALCRKCYRGAFSHWWKGGISTLNAQIRATKENVQWRKIVMFRDSFKCQVCESSKQLQAHHIKPFSQILKENKVDSIEEALNCLELWDTDNGITLCIPCHKLTDSYANKKVI